MIPETTSRSSDTAGGNLGTVNADGTLTLIGPAKAAPISTFHGGDRGLALVRSYAGGAVDYRGPIPIMMAGTSNVSANRKREARSPCS